MSCRGEVIYIVTGVRYFVLEAGAGEIICTAGIKYEGSMVLSGVAPALQGVVVAWWP